MISRETLGSHFPLRKLGDIAVFLDHMRRPVKEAEREPGPYPYYGANGIQGSIDSYLFDEPLILLAEDGGHFDDPERGIAYRVTGKTWVNNHAHVLRPRPEADWAYLTRVLENYDVSPFISGTTRGKLTKGQAEKIVVPLPPLPEQRRIAAILDQADALRAKRRAALAQLDEMAQAIFVEMFGAAPYGQYTLLGDCAVEFRYGTSNKSDIEGRPTLRIPNVIRNQIDLDDLKNVPVTDAEFRRLQLRPNDVLFVRTNGNPDNVGRCAWVDEDLGSEIGLSPSDFIFASYLIRARLNPERLRGVFTQAYFSTPDGRNQIREYAKTSAGQFNINTESLGALKVPLVPISAQSVFETRLRAVLECRRHHEAHATQLDSLFASLQHRAFNGEL